MSFAHLLGTLLQQGVTPQGPSRLEKAMGSLAAQSPPGSTDPLGGLLSGLLGTKGSTSPSSAASAISPLLELAQAFMAQKHATGLTGTQTGGLGALAGALLGGGSSAAKGAAGGSAMAVLATLALNALQSASQKRQTTDQAPVAGFVSSLPPERLEAALAPETSHLMIRAMISAAKADGQIDQDEMSRIFGKIGEDGTTPQERQAVMDELARPLDLEGLLASVPDHSLIAAEVYVASILAIKIDSEAERAYLRRLAHGLRLDETIVAELHTSVGLEPF
jgi:uncharacterized membrane protein YebE (DUF533 family)